MEHVDVTELEVVEGIGLLAPVARAVLDHICAGKPACRSIAVVAEWCDATEDGSYIVICPGCGERFVVDEASLGELRRWTDAAGNTLACGIRWE